jgi:PAS domain S-box-containing protein
VSKEKTKSEADQSEEISELRSRIADLERVTIEQDKRFHQIAENAREWIWEVDANGLYSYSSPLALQLFGYTPDEVIGKKHFFDFFHPEDRERLRLISLDFFAQKKPFNGFINRNITKNGRTIWMSTCGVPILDNMGNLLGYRGLDIDITELKDARDAFEESESRYKRITENVQYMIYRMSIPEGRYEYVSPAALNITGFPPEAYYLDPLLVEELIHPAWKEYFNEHKARISHGDVAPSYEFQIVDRHGRERWLYQRNLLVKDAAGRPIAIEGIVSDITERKRTEEALKESEASVRKKLNAILTPDGDTKELSLADVIDIGELQGVLEDFFKITGIPSAVLDISGKILVAVGWQDICTKFHRVHPETRKNCFESDTILSKLDEPGTFKFYQCKNYMWDVAAPIMVGNHHAGNLFIGQFILEETHPDYNKFRERARKYGFDEDEYLAALDKVPRWSREKIFAAMSFLAKLSGILSALSYGSVRLARSLAEKENLFRDLQASEERFRSFVENVHDVIYTLTPKGVFSYVSPNWKTLLGHEIYEVEGHPFSPFVHPDDVETCRVFLNQIMTEGISRSDCEYRVLHKNGGWRWHASSASRAYDAQGAPFFLGIARDVTERKRTEDFLLFLTHCGNTSPGEDFFESLALYLSENLSLEYVRIDRIDDSTQTITPVTVFSKIITGKLSSFVLDNQLWVKIASDPIFFVPENALVIFPKSKLLNKLHAESLIGTTLYNSRGTLIGLITLIGLRPVEDANTAKSILKLAAVRAAGELERRQVEEALLREKALTDALLDTTPGIIFLYDDQARLVRWNKKLEEITGFTPKELQGKYIMNWFLGDETSQESTQKALESMRNTGYGETEADLQTKNGPAIPMYFTACSLIFDGKPYFAGIGIDITERKRTEDEKDRLRNQLLQAQKMEAIGQLAGGVAHDFNNLLQVILGNLDILYSCHKDDLTQTEEIEEVRNAAQRAAELTGQLLAFSRRQIMRPVNLELNELIRSVLKMLRRVIGEHIDICFIPGDNVGNIFADKGQIEQVLMNLSVNARDAMAKGGMLTIRTQKVFLDDEFCLDHPWASEGDYTLITIADTGAGMNEETRARIFEPFFTTKEVGRGTGLGLATVYGIVKQHNGLVHVYSELGKGAEFKVYLPSVKGVSDSAEDARPAPPKGGAETILVAEDEPPVLKFITRMLTKAGYTVLPAHDGKEALRVFNERFESIDLVILDVMMPGLSGREVMDVIRKQHPDVLFLFSSGYSESALHTDFVIQEGLRLIQKPYRTDDLLREVRTILDEKHPGKAGAN